MKKLFILAMLFVLGTTIQAADAAAQTRARVDINSDDVVLKAVSAPEGGSLQNINWGKEKDSKFNLTGETALLPANRWIKASFTFMPENDGKVTINLMSNYTKDKDKKDPDIRWVYYDMIIVEGGSPLQNGDFEDAKGGKPVGWDCDVDLYIVTEIKAFSGKAIVKTCHNQRCSQTIDVKQGRQVIITVNVKRGEFEPAKE
jgi:hypothetical protein